MKNNISKALKISAIFFSLLGIVLNFIFAEADGYSHFSKRLLYFTSQSNLWIALIFTLILLQPYIKCLNNKKIKDVFYIIKYVFTVSITLTGFVFCAILAPGAENDSYNAWTPWSLIVHVVVPTLSIIDFLIDGYFISIKPRDIAFVTLPPLAYVIFSSVLFFLNVDFGRGEPFPYFFLNYSSPAGFFGRSDEMPYIIGSFYWLVALLLLILGIGAIYRILFNKTHKKGCRI